MKKRVLVFVFLVFFCGFVAASIQVGNVSHSISTEYGPSENIRGWINVSFNEEPVTSLFNSSAGDLISLIEVLKNSTGYNYNCVPSDCSSGYSASSEASSKSFSLNAGQTKLLGLKLTGDVASITSINFSVSSNAPSNCYNQLKIDLFDDGSIDIGNVNPSPNELCSFYNGCYDEDESEIEEYELKDIPYCQRISFSESPGFKIGAWIKQKTYGSKKIKMEIYNELGESKASCEINKAGITETGERVYCDANFLLTQGREFYVCISAEGYNGEYYTRGYTTEGKACGFGDIPYLGKEEIAAFDIFVRGKKFADVGTFSVGNHISDEVTFSDLATNYLFDKYQIGSKIDCSKGCIMPIAFKSLVNQNVVVSNVEVKYEKTGGLSVSRKEIYDVVSAPAKVSSGYGKLDLDFSGLRVNSEKGNHTYVLNFGGKSILSEKIFIKDIPQIRSLSPTTTFGGYPTKFYAQVSSSKNISSYKWSFGDGNSATTTNPEINHAYNSTGNYELKLTVTDTSQLNSTKSFEIYVGSPKEIINETLLEKKANLEAFQEDLENLTEFYKESLQGSLDFDEIEDELISIERAYKDSREEQDYVNVMKRLVALEVPESIYKSKSANGLSFFVNEDSINLDALKEAGGGSYLEGSASRYREAIIAWNNEKVDANMDFGEVSIRYEDRDVPTVRVFKLHILLGEGISSDPYLFIKNMSGLQFRDNYLEEFVEGYIAIELNRDDEVIEFATTEEVSFENVPIFIAPKLDRLTLPADGGEEPEGINWGMFVLIIILLLVFALVAYIVMQEWYKKKYESYLFKNRNNLYNIVSYIANAKKAGISESDIESKLAKSGWNSEQIKYALRKFKGERTGVIELIPMEKVYKTFEKFKKKKQEITTPPKYDPIKSRFGTRGKLTR